MIAVAHTAPPAAFEFANPEALWFLLFFPLWWILQRVGRPPTILFSRADVIARGPRSGRWYPRVLLALWHLLLLALVVALARPRIGTPAHREKAQGIDIEFLVDLSGSMLSEDYQPHNRLDAAKASLRQFILRRSADRIGLMAFASEAYTVTPLTTDYGVLLRDVDQLQVGQLDDGTAIGDAIVAGAGRLYRAPGASKVMILLTDGVNNRGTFDPLTGAAVANTFGIKLYTIGIGHQGVAPVPVMAPDSTSHLVVQPVEVDEPLLQQLAQRTRGAYFRAVDGAALDPIYQQIDTLARSDTQVRVDAHYAELYRWPLAFAIVCLLLELWIAPAWAPIP